MIDYDLLNKSVLFYESHGFKRIESPWLVTKAISDITRPEFASEYVVHKNNKEKIFVASGEQSFLYMINKGYLPKGKYQTITPCMRDDTFDEYHTKYFMKNELIIVGGNTQNDLDQIISVSFDFFLQNVPDKDLLKVKQDSNVIDIEYNGIELGSYGLRSCIFCDWCFGTGLALPRFSRAIGRK